MEAIDKVRAIDPFFEDAINQIFIHSEKTAFVMDGSLGVGKALADSEVVLTPKGFVPMGSLKVGDQVISKDGGSTNVTDVHPQGPQDIYKITFKNGSTVRCTLDHLWEVSTYYTFGKIVLNTSEIMSHRKYDRLYVPVLNQPDTEITDISIDGNEEATCIVIDHPSKLFVTNGFVLTHNSSNFVMQGAYDVSQLVTPIRKGNRMVRESKWAAVRESENSALATILQLLGEAIFTPEIMALDNSPVITYGSHPAKVLVTHDLPDGTILEMRIECHGFNNKLAHNRLRTHEFMGALIFEMQGIPFNIFEVTQERCGRYRTNDMTITKVIDGKKYTLSGLTKLAMVLCDVNIPERPHELYENYYDVDDKSDIPYMFITPPAPLLYKPVKEVSKKLLDMEKYPITKFEGEKVMWYPNPDCYNMTRHFEEKDDDGENIPWTGYSYWYNRLHRTDSEVRRYVLGIPDTVGGEAAIYKNFRRDDETITSRELNYARPVYLGYDPGGYAAVTMNQIHGSDELHFFKEFIFEPSDAVSTRQIFEDFVLPYCLKHLKHVEIIMVPDPASQWLGKNVMTGQEEAVINMVMDEVRKFKNNKHPNLMFTITPCMVSNQNTSARIDSLGYFIDQGKVTVDKDCRVLIAALGGGYQKKKLKSGIISENIDKDNPYSHPAEAAQYPAVNILTNIKKARNERQNSSKRRLYRVKRSRY